MKLLNKNQVHDLYKEKLKRMIYEFSMELTESDFPLSGKGLGEFIDDWIDKRIMPPREDWNPEED